MLDFIERLRTKPEHTRKQIALGAALAVTGVVTLAWGAALVSSGALAIAGTPAPSAPSVAPAGGGSGVSSLLSAVGSLTAKQNGSITVVETGASSTIAAQNAPEERTVIPF